MSTHSFNVTVRDQDVVAEFETERPEPDVGYYGGIDRSSLVLIDLRGTRLHHLEAALNAREWDDLVDDLWWKFN